MEDDLGFLGVFTRSDGLVYRKEVWVTNDNGPRGGRKPDVASWVEDLRNGLEADDAIEDGYDSLEEANENYRRPLTDMEKLDAEEPMKHPGFREGQVWARACPSGNFEFLHVDGPAVIMRLVVREYAATDIEDVLRGAYLVEDPQLGVAPWSPPETAIAGAVGRVAFLVPPTAEIALKDPEPRVPPREPDWKKAFAVLALHSCTGWVSSIDISRIVDKLRQAGEPEAAEALTKLFNSTRKGYEQDLMG